MKKMALTDYYTGDSILVPADVIDVISTEKDGTFINASDGSVFNVKETAEVVKRTLRRLNQGA